jgi:pimeloyl-ACP methyl ester carboxylesterase
MGGNEEFATLPTGRMRFHHEGDGPPVLLLHSVNTSSWTWRRVLPLLARDFEVFAVDMLGAGESSHPVRDGYGIVDHAQDILEFLKLRGLARAHLVGNSMGALIAIEAACIAPDAVGRLVLIGCPISTPEEGIRRLQTTRTEWFDSEGKSKPRSLEQQRSVWPRAKTSDVDDLNRLRVLAGRQALQAHVALAHYDVATRFPSVRSATLAIYGDGDPAAERKQQLVTGIKGASLALLPGLGHFPQLEEPEVIAGLVGSFLKQERPD